MNKICISGRLVTEPRIHTFSNQNQLTTIFIANNQYYSGKEKSGYYKINAWGRLGKIVAEHCRTGEKIFVTGRLEQSIYQDKEGRTRYDVSINMENIEFGENCPASAVIVSATTE